MGSFAVELQKRKGNRYHRTWARFPTLAQAQDYANGHLALEYARIYIRTSTLSGVRVVTTDDTPNILGNVKFGA